MTIGKHKKYNRHRENPYKLMDL